MKKILALSIAVAAGGCTVEPPSESAAGRSDSRLAEALQGRVASGPPQACVSQRDLTGNDSVGDGAIVFRTAQRDLLYVNRPAAGCPDLRFGRALKTRTPSARLCRGDIVEVFDPVSGVSFGGCGLGEFEPFRRPR